MEIRNTACGWYNVASNVVARRSALRRIYCSPDAGRFSHSVRTPFPVSCCTNYTTINAAVQCVVFSGGGVRRGRINSRTKLSGEALCSVSCGAQRTLKRIMIITIIVVCKRLGLQFLCVIVREYCLIYSYGSVVRQVHIFWYWMKFLANFMKNVLWSFIAKGTLSEKWKM